MIGVVMEAFYFVKKKKKAVSLMFSLKPLDRKRAATLFPQHVKNYNILLNWYN